MSDYLLQGIAELEEKVNQLERTQESYDRYIDKLEKEKQEIIQHAHECCDYEMQLELEERLINY